MLEQENGNSNFSFLPTRCVVRVQNGLTVNEKGKSTTGSNFFISVKNLKLVSLLYHNNALDLGSR